MWSNSEILWNNLSQNGKCLITLKISRCTPIFQAKLMKTCCGSLEMASEWRGSGTVAELLRIFGRFCDKLFLHSATPQMDDTNPLTHPIRSEWMYGECWVKDLWRLDQNQVNWTKWGVTNSGAPPPLTDDTKTQTWIIYGPLSIECISESLRMQLKWGLGMTVVKPGCGSAGKCDKFPPCVSPWNQPSEE